MTAANAIIDLGLKDVGYEYVNRMLILRANAHAERLTTHAPSGRLLFDQGQT